MDGIIILIGLIVLAIPVSIIVLFVGQSNLKSRLAVLERVVREQRAAVQDGPVPVAAVVPEIRAEAIPVVQVVAPEVAQTVAPWQMEASDAPDLAAQAMAAAAPDQDRPLVIRADRLGALLRPALELKASASVQAKNTAAQAAVERDRKFALPLAPNRLPEAPLPKDAPMSAPLPCWISTRPIIVSAASSCKA